MGVSVLRKFYGFHCLRLQELQKMVQSAEFVDVVQDGVGEDTTQIEYKVLLLVLVVVMVQLGGDGGVGRRWWG